MASAALPKESWPRKRRRETGVKAERWGDFMWGGGAGRPTPRGHPQREPGPGPGFRINFRRVL
jgi:hypothetical protein